MAFTRTSFDSNNVMRYWSRSSKQRLIRQLRNLGRQLMILTSSEALIPKPLSRLSLYWSWARLAFLKAGLRINIFDISSSLQPQLLKTSLESFECSLPSSSTLSTSAWQFVEHVEVKQNNRVSNIEFRGKENKYGESGNKTRRSFIKTPNPDSIVDFFSMLGLTNTMSYIWSLSNIFRKFSTMIA